MKEALRIPKFISIEKAAKHVDKSPAALAAWVRRYNAENPDYQIPKVHGAIGVDAFERAWNEAMTREAQKSKRPA